MVPLGRTLCSALIKKIAVTYALIKYSRQESNTITELSLLITARLMIHDRITENKQSLDSEIL